jgi:hypothetical protein
MAALPSLNSAKAHEIQDGSVPSLRSVFTVDNIGPEAYKTLMDRVPAFSSYESLLHAGSRPEGDYSSVRSHEVANLQFTR